MTPEVAYLIILLVLSGFFSSSETALFSISRSKAKYLSKQKLRSNQLI
jgi:putative hemolysin